MILIISCGSNKTPKISSTLASLGIDNSVIDIREFSEEILKNNNFSGIIISGAPILVTEIDPTPYIKQFNFIARIETPVLGICFGHQLLGMVYGANAKKCKEDRDWQQIDVLAPSILFKHINLPVSMMEDHCECIDVPTEFTLVASSNITPNEAMQHHSKPHFGVQFHPEVSSDQGARLLQNFCNLC